MTSSIDISKPAQGTALTLDVRNNFSHAKDEIEALQDATKSVKDFNAVGNGTTDDTTAIQNAVNSGGVVFVPAGTYLISSAITISNDVIIRGEGDSSIFLMKASTAANTFFSNTAAIQVKFENIKFDGNYANQSATSSNRAIRFDATTISSRETPRVLSINSCTFCNGSLTDILIQCDNDLDNSVTKLYISESYFYGGSLASGSQAGGDAYGPRYVYLRGGVSAFIYGCTFDTGLTSVPAQGRAGIVHDEETSQGAFTRPNELFICNNDFKHVGRSTEDGTLGCIDFYSGVKNSVISGNRLANSYGRAISGKAGSGQMIITNNICSDTTRGTASTTGNIGGDIVINGIASGTQPDNVDDNIIISNNISVNHLYRAIVVEGSNIADDQTMSNVLITGNIIQNAGQRAIQVSQLNGVIISTNIIKGGMADTTVSSSGHTAISHQDCSNTILIKDNLIEDIGNSSLGNGITCGTTTADTTADVKICDNTFRGLAGGSAIDNGSGSKTFVCCNNVFDTITNSSGKLIDMGTSGTGVTNGGYIKGNVSLNTGADTGVLSGMVFTSAKGFWVGDNNWDKSVAFSGVSKAVISSGAITAFLEFHVVAAESGTTDDLTTINNGTQGKIITLRAQSTDTITVKDGGTLKINGDFAMGGGGYDSITLLCSDGTNWVELSRSDNQ